MKRKLSLLLLVPLLIPMGMVLAQSSSSYLLQRHVTLNGGSASSANYAVTAVIGQSALGVSNSASYKVTGGFLHVQPQEAQAGHRFWLPVILK